MTLPWETAPPPPAPKPAPVVAPPPPKPTPPPALPAEAMQPDMPPPPAPAPIPVVATNTATGQKLHLEISEPLEAAIQQRIDDAVAAHPVLGAATKAAITETTFGDRILMHGSAIDLTVAVVAALSTIVSPNNWFTAAAWVVAGVLAAKTLLHWAVNRTSRGAL
jgi:hypothetical protein